MKYVKWIFVVVLISLLTSFIAKDKVSQGLSVGDVAPDFAIKTISGKQGATNLKSMRGNYVLLSFWASYDAPSRIRNAQLDNVAKSASLPIDMVSVSFDDYNSIFTETIRKDQLSAPVCFVETKGRKSSVFKKYNLKQGFSNYLLNADGVIIAKNISPKSLDEYLK